MSHFSNFVHAVTGCGLPIAAMTHGGTYAPTSDRRRTCPDNVTCLLDYREGFVTCFTAHFGSSIDSDRTVLCFERGSVQTRFGHAPGPPLVSGEGSGHPERPKEKFTLTLPPFKRHILDWLDCVRSRRQPTANMEMGYRQGVAVVLGDRAWAEGRKMVFEPDKRQSRPA